MCGRFTLSDISDQDIVDRFAVQHTPPLQSRYNIAPSQPVAAVRKDRWTGSRELTHLQWGLIPFWAEDPRIGNKLCNARAETVAEKPAFRGAFRYKRCLIPATGYYEWQKLDHGKQPFCFRLKGGELFALAGLWENWVGPDGSELETCTVITTEPNDLAAVVHNRMPVIVSPEDYALWLDPSVQRYAALSPVLRPYPAGAMEAFPVDSIVNDPRNEDPRCIIPKIPGSPAG